VNYESGILSACPVVKLKSPKDQVSHPPPSPGDSSAKKTRARQWQDKILLVAAAFAVCIGGGAAFWFAEDYHVNPAWVFFAWNSMLLVPLVWGDFRSLLKRPSFFIFLFGWMVLHGLTIVGLMRWVDAVYWIPILGVELFIGYFAAYSLFDVPPE
jgi:hypothetical protein